MDYKKKSSKAVMWCDLPSELVMKISDHHDSFIDKLLLRCVCSAWRAALRHHTCHHPFFHVSPESVIIGGPSTYYIFLIRRTIFLVSPVHDSNFVLNNSISSDIYPFIFKTEKILPNDNKFRAFPPFFFDPDRDYSILFPKVVNLSDIRITKLEDEFVLLDKYGRYYCKEKVVHLSLGNDDDYAVLAIKETTKLAMFRSVDHQWKIIDYMNMCFSDVISFNGTFYAVDYKGSTVEVSVDSGDVTNLAANLEEVELGEKYYLVQSGKELLLVVRHANDNENFLYKFYVYKLDRNNCKWVKISSLGDRVLFLGEGSTFWVSASDLKGFHHMRNHICYLDESFWRLRDIWKTGIGSYSLRAYDMEAGTDWDLDYHYYSELFWPVPSWITHSTSDSIEDSER